MPHRTACFPGAPLRRVAQGALAALAALVAAGCGQIRLPKATPAPELARIRERCPTFAVLSAEGIETGPPAFRGRLLVVVGVHHAYLRDLGPWLELLDGKGDGCARLVVIEDANPSMHAELAHSLPRDVEVCFDPSSKWDRAYAESFRLRRRSDDARLDSPRKADRLEAKARRMKAAADAHAPGFRRALGLVGEGPHVAVVGPDGTLLALVDGPREESRAEAVAAAIDEGVAGAKISSP